MDDQRGDILEFGKVLEILAREAASGLGRDFVLALRPLGSFEDAEERRALVRELIRLHEEDRPLALAGLFDAGELLRYARVEGSVLEEDHWPRLRALLQLGAELTAFRETSGGDFPAIAGLLAGVAECPELLKRLERTFDEDGALRDDATQELFTLRRRLRDAERNVSRTAARLAADHHGRGDLQDNFVTLRNGRQVLPVKAGHRGRVKGLLHGSSSSGETVYMEPFELVEAGNEVEELRNEERREVHRILRSLTAELRGHAEELAASLPFLAELDGLQSVARKSARAGWHLPSLVRKGPLRLFQAHHPLLQLRADGQSIPLTIILEREDRCVVLSGPNAGGKTTAMKMIGLNALLGRCGCPVPAFPDSQLPFFSAVLADIGDPQDLEEGVSTFSGHMSRIADLWRGADGEALVLLDELGTGTDPVEGGALAVALLEGFLGRAALTVTTSHLAPVKSWAEQTPGVRNASFSLDPRTHEPTFRLRLDVPGASEALHIAEREGLAGSILGRARELVGEPQLKMGEMLRRLEEREQELAAALREAEARAKTLGEQEQLLRARADLLRTERRELRAKVLQEQGTEAKELRERLERLIAELPSEEDARRRKEALVQAREEVLRAQELNAAGRRRLAEEQVERGELTAGQRVFVRSLGQWGELTALEGGGEDARVAVGQMEVRTRREDLLAHDPRERREEQREQSEDLEWAVTGGKKRKRPKKGRRLKKALREAEEYSPAAYLLRRPGSQGQPAGGAAGRVALPASMLLDLHGFRVDEALAELDKFLDRALLADFPYVKICHGTGTGRLYKAVHEYLRTHPAARKYRFATPDEGGGGVTIVEF